MRPVSPILVLPFLGSVVVGFLMYRVVGGPIQQLMASLTAWLRAMSTGSSVVLALVLGAMIAFDMGGPVNKVAFFFGAAMIKEGNVAVMGACAAAICVPPLGLGLATLLGRKLWTDEERCEPAAERRGAEAFSYTNLRAPGAGLGIRCPLLL